MSFLAETFPSKRGTKGSGKNYTSTRRIQNYFFGVRNQGTCEELPKKKSSSSIQNLKDVLTVQGVFRLS